MTFAFDDDGLFMRMADGATLIAAMKLFFFYFILFV